MHSLSCKAPARKRRRVAACSGGVQPRLKRAYCNSKYSRCTTQRMFQECSGAWETASLKTFFPWRYLSLVRQRRISYIRTTHTRDCSLFSANFHTPYNLLLDFCDGDRLQLCSCLSFGSVERCTSQSGKWSTLYPNGWACCLLSFTIGVDGRTTWCWSDWSEVSVRQRYACYSHVCVWLVACTTCRVYYRWYFCIVPDVDHLPNVLENGLFALIHDEVMPRKRRVKQQGKRHLYPSKEENESNRIESPDE